MLSNGYDFRGWLAKGLRYRSSQLSRVTVILWILAGVLFFSSAPALSQQRVVVDKATGYVVDVGDQTLQYDTRYYDNLDLSTSPVPAGANARKYMRDAAGNIVLRPKSELIKNFDDEWRSDLISRINGSTLTAEAKGFLIDIVKGVRR